VAAVLVAESVAAGIVAALEVALLLWLANRAR
jgi:hypothetical protein